MQYLEQYKIYSSSLLHLKLKKQLIELNFIYYILL